MFGNRRALCGFLTVELNPCILIVSNWGKGIRVKSVCDAFPSLIATRVVAT